MRILGIDPGTLSAGFAILDGERGATTLLQSGVIKLHRKKSIAQRVHQFHTQIEQIIIMNGITHIAIETPFFNKNMQSFIKLGYIRGSIYFLSEEYCLPLFEYAPTQIKQAITSWGHAPKGQVASVLYRLFPGLSTGLSNDITDAIAIGLTGLWKNSTRLALLQK